MPTRLISAILQGLWTSFGVFYRRFLAIFVLHSLVNCKSIYGKLPHPTRFGMIIAKEEGGRVFIDRMSKKTNGTGAEVMPTKLIFRYEV